MKKYLLFIFISLITVSSCKKDDNDDEMNLIDCSNSTGNPTNLEFVEIQGGTFDMGCTDNIAAVYNCGSHESSVHSVTLSDFKLSKYEVTNTQYAEFLNDIGAESDGYYDGVKYIEMGSSYCKIEYNGSTFTIENGRENHPVVEVTWFGANAYCEGIFLVTVI